MEDNPFQKRTCRWCGACASHVMIAEPGRPVLVWCQNCFRVTELAEPAPAQDEGTDDRATEQVRESDMVMPDSYAGRRYSEGT